MIHVCYNNLYIYIYENVAFQMTLLCILFHLFVKGCFFWNANALKGKQIKPERLATINVNRYYFITQKLATQVKNNDDLNNL